MVPGTDPILSIRKLSVYYPRKSNLLQFRPQLQQILFQVDLDLYAGRILALVGESGSGKSTLGEAICGLIPDVRGELYFHGQRYLPISAGPVRRKIQLIFQDPLSALNPRLTAGQTLREVLHLTQNESPSQEAIPRLLEQVQLPAEVARKYPHELSGGQCQRVCIARALAANPEILICDEITSALDVSIQAKILNLLKTIMNRRKLALLFLTHDLNLVRTFADEVIVLYQGRIIERGETAAVFDHPQQSYTRQLFQAVPQKWV
jgi:peptide/nickel transport system ATP-binding protein